MVCMALQRTKVGLVCWLAVRIKTFLGMPSMAVQELLFATDGFTLSQTSLQTWESAQAGNRWTDTQTTKEITNHLTVGGQHQESRE